MPAFRRRLMNERGAQYPSRRISPTPAMENDPGIMEQPAASFKPQASVMSRDRLDRARIHRQQGAVMPAVDGIEMPLILDTMRSK